MRLLLFVHRRNMYIDVCSTTIDAFTARDCHKNVTPHGDRSNSYLCQLYLSIRVVLLTLRSLSAFQDARVVVASWKIHRLGHVLDLVYENLATISRYTLTADEVVPRIASRLIGTFANDMVLEQCDRIYMLLRVAIRQKKKKKKRKKTISMSVRNVVRAKRFVSKLLRFMQDPEELDRHGSR